MRDSDGPTTDYGLVAYDSSIDSLTLGSVTASTGIMRFIAAGSEAARIDSSGNLGIGITSPVSPLTAARGNVTGAGQWASSAIAVYNPTNTGSYSQISFGYTVGTTNAAAYIGYVSTNQGTNGYGDLVFGTRAVNTDTQPTDRARITSGGSLLVAKTTTNDGDTGFMFEPIRDGAGNGRLTITQSSSTNSGVSYSAYSSGAAAYRFYVGMGGTVFATSTTISAISDIRFKENVRDLNVGLVEVMALKPRLYDWKEGKGQDIKNARGFIAQEFEEVFPDLIDEWKDPAPEGEDPYKSVRADLIPVLVKAIQEQQAIIQTLTDRITALEQA